ncbi:MAG TPA: bifunctional glutamate N-acetyltransferase/amino-acid acetyltransferase ArgJ [Sedimentisphaerales bacterium]|nr:bifunctional glutamate N-acetyltransferase/amino-acid acetyltransferase ArgJ [Sedimentisphaerales bacterium]
MRKKLSLQRIERDLASSDEDTRWQAAIVLCEYCESDRDAELIWPLIVKWGSHENEDVRMAIATCVLEHILGYHFDTYFEKCAEIIRSGNLMFGFTFSMCGKFDQSRDSINSKRMDALDEEYHRIKERQEHMANNTITAPRGFLAAGVRCGIKKSGKADLGLIVCPTGAKSAAVFTTNKIVSAAVTVSKKHVKSRNISAVIVNSGNANACTGRIGTKNAIRMCSETAKQIEVEPHGVLVASTGIIGEQLPIKKINAGISKVAERLSASASAGLDFARAIMTTDTRVKQAVRRIEISGKNVTIAGATKGAGMIGPNMATTLCFITTDVAISKPLLGKALKTAIGNSLNKLTVDAHQSTNDTAIILASGLAGNRPITSQCPRYKKFTKALVELCEDLARQMMLDAEGVTRMFRVVVNGAATKADATKVCRAIADYPLVKCAVHGGDPNWGRIICAVGSAGVRLNPNKLSCKLGDITVFKNGTAKKFDAKKASKVISQTEHTITVDLGVGKKSDFCYGCDLSAEYVKINAEYHT